MKIEHVVVGREYEVLGVRQFFIRCTGTDQHYRRVYGIITLCGNTPDRVGDDVGIGAEYISESIEPNEILKEIL